MLTARRQLVALILCGCLLALGGTLQAQDLSAGTQPDIADQLAEEALADAAPQPAAEATSAPLLELFYKGGWLMAPIVLMSILVLAIGIERQLGLRRSRVLPRALERGLRQLSEVGDFEPRTAYRICQSHPSVASRIVMAMIGKAGRPHAEVESAANDAIQRAADHLYAHVRTLNLAAAVTPLMGLLGTVWGMIAAFFATASLPLGSNKGQALAEGIYVALVTTFAGLAVAIPAAVLAHFFESKILRHVRSIEDLVAELMPRMERHEGGPRFRLSQQDGEVVFDSEEYLRASASGSATAIPDWPHPGPPAPHGDLQSEQPRPEHRESAEPWQS